MKRTSIEQSKIGNFNRFLEVAEELGYRVRVTGGCFLTHDINCSKEEFDVILELSGNFNHPENE